MKERGEQVRPGFATGHPQEVIDSSLDEEDPFSGVATDGTLLTAMDTPAILAMTRTCDAMKETGLGTPANSGGHYRSVYSTHAADYSCGEGKTLEATDKGIR